jgi:hypothetical protein
MRLALDLTELLMIPALDLPLVHTTDEIKGKDIYLVALLALQTNRILLVCNATAE